MTFKIDAVKRTLTGTFQRPDGVPSKGKVFLQFSESVRGREENTVYTPQKVEIVLDVNGAFSQDIAVTAPGLTTEELLELADVQTQRVTNLNDLAAVQILLNTYLNKLASNQTVTELETTNYNTNVETKKDLQVLSIELSKSYQKLLDKQRLLEDNVVRAKMTFELNNPVSKGKIEFIIPPGDDPIDIADLPKV